MAGKDKKTNQIHSLVTRHRPLGLFTTSPRVELTMASIGWSRFKELSGVVTASVIHKQHDAFFSLEKALRKHKLDFLNLLKNPVSACIMIVFHLNELI